MSGDGSQPGPHWDARLYDDRHGFVWQHGAALIGLLAPKRGDNVLDLGCGTGHLTARIAAAASTVLGIDSSPEMIAAARTAHPGLRFEVADARALAFTGEFDAVFSNAVLHWIGDADAVVRGVARALKRGGRFVAEFGGDGNVRAITTALRAGLEAVGRKPVESPWYFPTIAEYAEVLGRGGLEVRVVVLFDRPTPLEGGENGLRDWVRMFGGHFLAQLPDERRDEYLAWVEDALRPVLFRDGGWVADYRRLRVVAVRPGGVV
ncbi:MAG: Methyltransferase type 11 [Gemmataceae bacterium]|nr:Methyltransferase type 11 [Gemmataceae bacterium]